VEWLAIAGIVLGALVFTRISGLVLRRMIRRMAERGVEGRPSRFWRAAVRYGGIDRTDTGALRRRQRVDAAARMVNHIVTVVMCICVTIAIFQILDIDAAFFISSAGFIGAGLAIGGQHKVNDYLTGLEVLFEDRYGVGDELVVEQLWPRSAARRRRPRRVVLDPAARRHEHVARAEWQPRARAQRQPAGAVRHAASAQTVRELAGSENLTDVIFVGDLAAQRRDDGDIDVEVKTTRPLDPRSREILRTKAEDTLRGGL
jgi:hypothetical protein